MSLKNSARAAEKADRKAADKPADGVGATPWSVKPPGGSPAPGVSAADLIDREFPPAAFVVDRVLPGGLSILGGRPKQGKSWLSLLIAWAVAAGYEIDGRTVWPGKVLYLALEDTERRLRDRLRKLRDGTAALRDGRPWEVPTGLTLNTAWPRADAGGLYHLAEWLSANKADARLVIVDTLGRFRKPQKGSGNSYAEDYEAAGDIKQLLDSYGVAGVVVHHTRKLRAEDPFDELSGTLGLSGAADSLFVLDRERGDSSARLYGTGRDLGELTVPMTFDPAFCLWRLAANVEGIDVTNRSGGGSASPAVNKLEQCKAWLKEFLREYAYPSDEIQVLGVKAGFAPTTVREAKRLLGSNGTGEITNRQLDGGQWWSGIGPAAFWKRRPPAVPEIPD